jgi:hypothetical protein
LKERCHGRGEDDTEAPQDDHAKGERADEDRPEPAHEIGSGRCPRERGQDGATEARERREQEGRRCEADPDAQKVAVLVPRGEEARGPEQESDPEPDARPALEPVARLENAEEELPARELLVRAEHELHLGGQLRRQGRMAERASLAITWTSDSVSERSAPWVIRMG